MSLPQKPGLRGDLGGIKDFAHLLNLLRPHFLPASLGKAPGSPAAATRTTVVTVASGASNTTLANAPVTSVTADEVAVHSTNGQTPIISLVHGNYVDTGTAQVIGGGKTFSVAPIMSGANISNVSIPDAALAVAYVQSVGASGNLSSSGGRNPSISISNAPTFSGLVTMGAWSAATNSNLSAYNVGITFGSPNVNTAGTAYIFAPVTDSFQIGFQGTARGGTISLFANGFLSPATQVFAGTGTMQGAGLIATAAAPTVAAGQIGYGGTTSASATAGGGAALPATVLGFIVGNVAGVTVKIPYYAA